MKKIFFLAIISLMTLTYSFANKRLELSEDKGANPADLKKRIRQLQEAVIDLQSRVDSLEAKLGASTTGGAAGGTTTTTSAAVTCYIESPFDGIFDATSPTETKARIEAVKSCMNKVKSRIHCAAEKVKCGQ